MSAGAWHQTSPGCLAEQAGRYVVCRLATAAAAAELVCFGHCAQCCFLTVWAALHSCLQGIDAESSQKGVVVRTGSLVIVAVAIYVLHQHIRHWFIR